MNDSSCPIVNNRMMLSTPLHSSLLVTKDFNDEKNRGTILFYMKNLGTDVVVTKKLTIRFSIKMAQIQGLDVVHPVTIFRRFSVSSPLTFLGHLCANPSTPKSASVKCDWLPQYLMPT